MARCTQQIAQWPVIAYQNNSKHFFILVTKEIRLFHLRILLTSLNIYSDHKEKLGNGIRIIYYIVSCEPRKNSVWWNENIQHYCFFKN